MAREVSAAAGPLRAALPGLAAAGGSGAAGLERGRPGGRSLAAASEGERGRRLTAPRWACAGCGRLRWASAGTARHGGAGGGGAACAYGSACCGCGGSDGDVHDPGLSGAA